MPPRRAVLAIVVFWLATTSWLIYREVLPAWQAAHGQPPTFTPGFLEEIGANYTSWQILIGAKDKDSRTIVWRTAGTGRSEVLRQPDRSFVFGTVLTFTKPRLADRISKIESTYRVTEDGKLLGVDVKVRLPTHPLEEKPLGRDGDAEHQLDFTEYGVRAKVENGDLKVSFRVGDEGGWGMNLPPIRLPKQGSILNPVQLGNKITGLWAGQTWSVPLFNPLAAADPSQAVASGDQLTAKVSEEILVWDTRLAATARPGDVRPSDEKLQDALKVPCFRIDFRKPGEQEPTATSWVRQRDGMVLQQVVTDNRYLYLKLIRGN